MTKFKLGDIVTPIKSYYNIEAGTPCTVIALTGTTNNPIVRLQVNNKTEDSFLLYESSVVYYTDYTFNKTLKDVLK